MTLLDQAVELMRLRGGLASMMAVRENLWMIWCSKELMDDLVLKGGCQRGIYIGARSRHAMQGVQAPSISKFDSESSLVRIRFGSMLGINIPLYLILFNPFWFDVWEGVQGEHETVVSDLVMAHAKRGGQAWQRQREQASQVITMAGLLWLRVGMASGPACGLGGPAGLRGGKGERGVRQARPTTYWAASGYGGEKKLENKRSGAGPAEKTAQEAKGKKSPFSISKPFTNCKLT
jgi:hypothetical protein